MAQHLAVVHRLVVRSRGGILGGGLMVRVWGVTLNRLMVVSHSRFVHGCVVVGRGVAGQGLRVVGRTLLRQRLLVFSGCFACDGLMVIGGLGLGDALCVRTRAVLRYALQGIAQDSTGPNTQGIAQAKAANNHQPIASEAATENQQALPQQGATDNTQTLASDAPPNNHAAVNEAAVADNHQPIEGDTPNPNHQAAPEDAPPGPNNQAVDNGKVLSHFEKTPETAIVRNTVDFTHATHSSGSTAARTTSASTRKPLAKAAPRTLTEAERLQRQKMMEAFHGRVAGIKQNVDQLNNRLTTLEEEVEKVERTLIKGDPDQFDIEE